MNLNFAEVQIFVSDLKASRKFYVDALGFIIEKENDQWLILNAGGLPLVIASEIGAAKNDKKSSQTGKQVLCFLSKDLKTDVKKLKEKGVNFISEIEEKPEGKHATIQDPDGNLIELIE